MKYINKNNNLNKKYNTTYARDNFKGINIANEVVDNVSNYRNGKSVIRNKKDVFNPLVFEDFNYLMSKGFSLTDIDGIFEVNRNIFIVESKTHFNSINAGQLILLLNNAYNTYLTGKLAQVVIRIDMRDDNANQLYDAQGQPIFTYIIFGSKQFEQMKNFEEPTPDIIENKTNHWLARRMQQFEKVCAERQEYETNRRNSKLFGLPNKLKEQIKSSQEEARKYYKHSNKIA